MHVTIKIPSLHISSMVKTPIRAKPDKIIIANLYIYAIYLCVEFWQGLSPYEIWLFKADHFLHMYL